MTAPVAIFGIGNRSRGDDALGPLLLDRLGDWLEAQGLAGGFDLIEAYQLQVEHSLDLEGRRLALFIDACRDAQSPLTFGPVGAAGMRPGHSTHELDPGTVLGVFMRVTGEAPPPSFILGIRATDFELGAGLSACARDSLEDAWALLHALVHCPRHSEWQTMAAVARAPRALPA